MYTNTNMDSADMTESVYNMYDTDVWVRSDQKSSS